MQKLKVILGLGWLLMAWGIGAMSAGELKATGFVRVEKVDGVWWFVGPDGRKFISMGVNHIEPHLWVAPYNKEATIKKYGADFLGAQGQFDTHSTAAKKWMDRQLEICGDLHFNTLGKHTHPSIDPQLFQDRIYYVVSLETASLSDWREQKGQGPRPDVFSSEFWAFVEQRVATITEQHKDSRHLLGYLYTDIPDWISTEGILGLGAGKKGAKETVMVYPWVNAILGLGDYAAGKQRWIRHLQERYPDAASAAHVWGLEVSPTYGTSWETLARLTSWSKPADPVKADADMRSFLAIIADQYYALHREIILRHDPNHLIFGDKNMINWHFDFVLPLLRKYVDVVAVQAYDRWSVDEPYLDQIYEATGKPIFNGDGCFAFAGPHQQKFKVKGWWTGAKSVEDVAALYKETLEGMMAKSYMVGWHHCGYLQQWDEAERGDVPSNETGFIDPFENYETVWTDVIREVNARLSDLHARAKPTLAGEEK